ncbi:MAG: hypothetical protein ACTSPU_15730 [Promethearchaeota archaeon]
MEKNSSNRYIIKIEKALEELQSSLKKSLFSKRKICGELRNNVFALQADNSLSDPEFFDVIGEICQRKPMFFMLWIYPKMRDKLRKVYGNEGLRVMDKYILEKFCLDEGERIIHEFNGTLKLKAAKKYVIRINNGYVYVTNHRIVAQGKISLDTDYSAKQAVLEFAGISTKTPLGAKIAYLSGSKPCYGYYFGGVKHISYLSFEKKRKLTYSVLSEEIDITINVSKKDNTGDKLYQILDKSKAQNSVFI